MKTENNLKRLGVPLMVGLAAGIGTQYLINRARERAKDETLASYAPPRPIDWDRARRVALRVSSWDQFPVLNRSEREAQYLFYVRQSEEAIATYLGVNLPQPTEQVIVVDRRAWLEANFASLKAMLEPVETLYAKLYADGRGNRWEGPVAGVQLGGIFGYLARRVLGQYELGLLSPRPQEQGVLYFVEPNIERLQTQLGLSDEFRFWIALHEVTHVFEFEAYGWVREHFSSLLERFLTLMTKQLAEQGVGLDSLLKRLARGASFERHWLSWMMSEEERTLFEELQALMSLVEGYSDHVMNELGRQLLSRFDEIERKVKARKRTKSPLEEGLERLIGLDLKRAQYREGEAFVNGVIAARDLPFLQRVWEEPRHLPGLSEIRDPRRWIARIERESG